MRVAASRAQESLAQVEAIVKLQTEAELCQRIDADFETRIVDLNSQFASRLAILKYFPAAKNQLQLCSNKDGVELAIGPPSRLRFELMDKRPVIGEAFEIWLRRNEDLVTNGPRTFSKAPIWFSTYLSETPLFQKPDERKWGIEIGENWMVVKLRE